MFAHGRFLVSLGRALVSRRAVCAFAACMAASLMLLPARAAEPLKVVASFSILGDMVRVIGGENITLTTLVGPNADAHAYDPSARDNRVLAEAQVLVTNGLGFEAWMPRLVRSSGFKGLEIVASRGVTPRQLDADDDHDDHGHADHGHGSAEGGPAVDPHAWQDLENGVRYANNIANGLSRVDPANRAKYQARAELYVAEMKKLHAEIQHSFAEIPADRRRVVTPHDAFGYFSQAYGVTFFSVAGLSSDAEPSARDIARLIRQIKTSESTALFADGSSNSRVLEQIGRETEIKVGSGGLFADTLDVGDKPAGTYLGMLKWNAGQLIFALKP